jgi:hypothetical protein
MDQETDANKNPDPEKNEEGITRKELIEQLEAQVEYFEKLPAHEKFSFAINADLYYFMLLIVNILKRGV